MSDTQLKPTEQELRELVKGGACYNAEDYFAEGTIGWHMRLAGQLAQAELDRRATEGSGDVEAFRDQIEAWIEGNQWVPTGIVSFPVISANTVRLYIMKLLREAI